MNKDENKSRVVSKEQVKEIIQEITQAKADKVATLQRTTQIVEAYKNNKKQVSLRRPLEEPIMLFGRRNGTFEIYEHVTQGRWDFKHSNGDERFIIIDPNKQCKLGTGKDQARMYWAHEDYPVSGWPEPITTTEQINIFVEKTLADAREWMLKKQGLKNQMWLYIAAGIALIIFAVGLMRSMSPQAATVIVQGVANVTQNETVKAVVGAVANGSQIL